MAMMTIVVGYTQPNGPEGEKIPITELVEVVDSDGHTDNGGWSVLPAPDVIEMLTTI